MLRSIFARAVTQITVGLVGGVVVAAILERLTAGGLMHGYSAVLLPTFAAIMGIVGLLATLGPARRALRIQPTEALRSD